MKKRIFALSLLLALLLTVSAVAVSGTENFVRTRHYGGEFSDLPAASVFYGNVTALYEYGLSVGKGDGTFGLTDPVTVNQAVIFAGRIRSLYDHGDPEAGAAAFSTPGQVAYEPYARYLRSLGVIGGELDSLYGTAATRSVVAHLLANTLPAEALPDINGQLIDRVWAASRRFLPDLEEGTPWLEDILFLYRRGITQGSDDVGTFYPDAPITRGALAAMLTRMVDPALRVTPAWNTAPAAPTLASLVPPGRHIPSPATKEELSQSLCWMLAAGSSRLELHYPGISAMQARQLMEQALSIVKRFCEQSYNSVTCTYNLAGQVVLTFSAVELSSQEIDAYRQSALESALTVQQQLRTEGLLTDAMTQRERAQVLYTWICQHCVYDYDAGETSLSHIPYSLFTRGTAVCDGYTGAYNLLLKLEGIDCYALSNQGHIWTVATLDGQEVHIDTTWGDSGPSAGDPRYFAMTPEQSWQAHPW